MTQPTEATIAPSDVEPSAPAALTLTRRAPGATPWKPDVGIVAGDDAGHVRAVPVGVEVGQVAVAALVGEVGALDDLALAASAGTGTMPVSMTATSTPLPVAPDWSAPIA